MFRIGIGDRSLLDRIESARNRFDADVIPPGVPASVPALLQPFHESPVDTMNEAPREQIGNLEAIDAIATALVAQIKGNDDTEAKELFLQFTDIADRLKSFFASRSHARRRTVEAQIFELTKKGRVILDRIETLKQAHAAGLVQLNASEESAGRLRVRLICFGREPRTESRRSMVHFRGTRRMAKQGG